ncbi:MAG: helix-turn-helix domain-containing protein [Alphaproteobacteria bacterium]|nr:helix-turn-helix domain-containing protein [Alphaproteobacteria bacterium]
MKNKNISRNPAIACSWEELKKELLTPEEITEMDLRVQLIGAMIEARQKKGLSQRKLEELSGVKQPIIARMEKGSTSPQLSTFLKLLYALGKTLKVVDIKRGKTI